MFLIRGRIGDFVRGRLEMPSGHNLERLADIDNDCARLVPHGLPSALPGPDVQRRDGDGEEERGGAVVRVAVHADAVAPGLVLGWEGVEEGVPEVAVTDGAGVGLDVRPEVVVGELQDAGEQGEEAAVDGVGEVLLVD